MRKGFSAVGIVVIVITMLFIGSCVDASVKPGVQSPSPTGVSISDTTVSVEIDANKKAIDPKNTFGKDVPEIHCSFKLSNAPANTVINTSWIHVLDADKKPLNKPMYSLDVIGEGTRYLDVYMVKPNQGWTLGSYKVVLYISGEEKASVQYEVKAGEAPYKPKYAIGATMAAAVDEGSKPLNQTNTFTPITAKIYCVVKTANLPENTEIRVRWTYIAGDQPSWVGKTFFEDMEMVGGGTHYVAFYHNKPDTGFWPRGDYIVKVYLNGTEKSFVPFIVR
jgi:hypothetical protein